MLRTRYRAYAPSTTKLWRGICQRLTGTESFFIFDNHFSFSGKMLTSHKDFFCSSLFPLCLPSGVLLPCRDVCFPFTRPATTFFSYTVFNGPNFLTAKSYLHVHVCLSPPSPTPLFSVPSTSSVWSTSSSPSAPSTAPSVSWCYCFIVLGPLLFIILDFL